MAIGLALGVLGHYFTYFCCSVNLKPELFFAISIITIIAIISLLCSRWEHNRELETSCNGYSSAQR